MLGQSWGMLEYRHLFMNTCEGIGGGAIKAGNVSFVGENVSADEFVI